MLKKIEETACYLKDNMPFLPKVGIVLGTGLGELASQIKVVKEFGYKDIPNFPISTVEGHSGRLILGYLGEVQVLAMQGRFHYYEGYSMTEVTFPIRVMKALGIEILLLSNAAGGTNPEFEIGELMIISDHINCFPENPLRGKNYNELGTRFPDMSRAYDADLIANALSIAEKHQIRVKTGVYLGTQGPMYETPAEYKYFRTIGADAVGMSTVPEVIVAVHSNMRVFAMSIITDLGVEGKIVEVTHEEVQQIANSVQPKMTLIMKELISSL